MARIKNEKSDQKRERNEQQRYDKMKYKKIITVKTQRGGTNKEIYQPAVGLVKNQEEPMVCLAEVISLLVLTAASSAEMTT